MRSIPISARVAPIRCARAISKPCAPISAKSRPALVYEDEDVKIWCDYVEHIPREISECFGIRFEAEGKTLAFSGDTSPCDAMIELARNADVLFHECTFPEAFVEFRKKSGVGTFAHTPPSDLGRIARDAGVKSLVATHFGPFRIHQHR